MFPGEIRKAVDDGARTIHASIQQVLITDHWLLVHLPLSPSTHPECLSLKATGLSYKPNAAVIIYTQVKNHGA